MDADELIENINTMLVSIDQCLSVNDVNGAIKKTHECMLKINGYKESHHV